MITVLDGGMGQELIRRGGRTGLWSAQALLDAPELVAEVHRDYVLAGADIITTNTYSTIPSYLAKAGMADRYLELTALAGGIAREVADAADREITVAGSIPPLEESYRPDLVMPDELAQPIYRELASTLAPYVDVFFCETMSCTREARNAAAAVSQVSDKPVYVSWTLGDKPGTGLRSSENIGEAVAALDGVEIAGYLFNCTSPEAISAGLRELRLKTDKPIGAYPNRFFVPEGWTLDNDVDVELSELDEQDFVTAARSWAALGATIIGGCCGIGPGYIAALKQALG